MKNNIIYLALGLLLAMNTGCGADEESTDDGDMAGDTAGEMTAGETTAGESTAGDSAAGETAGDTAGETAGDSSAGTVAAGESAAGEMMVVDGGTCEAPYEFTDAGDGSSTAEGVLSGDDSSGSCSSPDVDVAEDAVVHFTAPEAGTYRFDTISSFGLDTIIYLQATCGDQGSELECNDDFGSFEDGEVQSQIIINMEAGQEVFLVVDSFATESGSENTPFVARVEQVSATAPVLESVEVVFNPNDFTLAARVNGVDPESDVDIIGFIFEIDGVAQEAIEVPFADFGLISFDGENFNGEVVGGLGPDFAGITSASVYVSDALNLVSDQVTVEVAAPVEIAIGEACDLIDGFSACAEGSLCIPESEEASTGTCSEVFPPVLTEGVAGYNADLNNVGFVVNGTDATPEGADIDGFEVTFLDEAGTDLLGQSISLGLDVIVDEVDPSIFTATFSGGWVEPDQMVGAPVTISVTAFDALGLASDPIMLTVETPTAVEADASCDAYGALNVCGEGYVCIETCTLTENIDYTCPEDWTVTEIALDTPLMGDNSASTIMGESSCGGGGPSDVYSFTAATAGTYHFTAISADEMVDMLIYARSYCGSFTPSFELACNDDYVDYNSGLEVELAEGDTMYLFIDSYLGGNGGTYEVTATSGSLPEVEE
jgi:hypothetical protein